MKVDFLKKILKTRDKEIEEGKNLATRQPIYIVYDVSEYYTTYDGEYSCLERLSHKYQKVKHGAIIEEGDIECEPNFIEDSANPQVTMFYKDIYKGIFLTSEGAYDYLEYQKHNMSSLAYVYVEYTGYANREMDLLFKELGTGS